MSILAGFHDHAPLEESFREAVLRGLSATPKSVPSKWIYDERGSRLFEAVCEAPEYYPTRTEISLLEAHADEIAILAGPDCALVEFGSGASHKVRLLLNALARPAVYVPVDIDSETLRRTAESIAADYPETAVVAVHADLTQPFPLPETATRVSGARLAKKIARNPHSRLPSVKSVGSTATLRSRKRRRTAPRRRCVSRGMSSFTMR